jgi:hypothetical protein
VKSAAGDDQCRYLKLSCKVSDAQQIELSAQCLQASLLLDAERAHTQEQLVQLASVASDAETSGSHGEGGNAKGVVAAIIDALLAPGTLQCAALTRALAQCGQPVAQSELLNVSATERRAVVEAAIAAAAPQAGGSAAAALATLCRHYAAAAMAVEPLITVVRTPSESAIALRASSTGGGCGVAALRLAPRCGPFFVATLPPGCITRAAAVAGAVYAVLAAAGRLVVELPVAAGAAGAAAAAAAMLRGCPAAGANWRTARRKLLIRIDELASSVGSHALLEELEGIATREAVIPAPTSGTCAAHAQACVAATNTFDLRWACGVALLAHLCLIRGTLGGSPLHAQQLTRLRAVAAAAQESIAAAALIRFLVVTPRSSGSTKLHLSAQGMAASEIWRHSPSSELSALSLQKSTPNPGSQSLLSLFSVADPAELYAVLTKRQHLTSDNGPLATLFHRHETRHLEAFATAAVAMSGAVYPVAALLEGLGILAQLPTAPDAAHTAIAHAAAERLASVADLVVAECELRALGVEREMEKEVVGLRDLADLVQVLQQQFSDHRDDIMGIDEDEDLPAAGTLEVC